MTPFFSPQKKTDTEYVMCSLLLSMLSAGSNAFKKFQFSHFWFDLREASVAFIYCLAFSGLFVSFIFRNDFTTQQTHSRLNNNKKRHPD